MDCSQCSRPALYEIGDGDQRSYLCLSCYTIVDNIRFRNWLTAAAMSNQALDDMDAIIPIGPRSGRIPVAEIAKAALQASTYNNIHITNSNVGVINTGDLARIDAAITMAKGTDLEEFGARLKDLTDAIMGSNDIVETLKQEMIEISKALSDQVIGSKKPSKTVISALFDKAKGLSSGIITISGGFEKLSQAWDAISKHL